MNEPKPFASLTPTLLARKGGAKPAMRPQLAPLPQFHEATARQFDDDLGWNDMGEDATAGNTAPPQGADIVPIGSAAPAEAKKPEVLRQRETAAKSIARGEKQRRSALADGRRAAFTLRMDSDRHLQLRLACTVTNRSAQQIVTEALDRLLSEMPEIGVLAEQVRKRR